MKTQEEEWAGPGSVVSQLSPQTPCTAGIQAATGLQQASPQKNMGFAALNLSKFCSIVLKFFFFFGISKQYSNIV